MSLILSNLSYAVTGQDDTLEMYAIEKQIASLNKIMDETMELATNSTGDGKRFMEEIKSLSEQIVVLREQLEAVQGRLKSNERVYLFFLYTFCGVQKWDRKLHTFLRVCKFLERVCRKNPHLSGACKLYLLRSSFSKQSLQADIRLQTQKKSMVTGGRVP